MTNGVIDYLDFDDDCSLCSNDYCIDGNCAQKVTDCTSFNGVTGSGSTPNTDCSFKLYVSWSGTDAQGTYLASAGRRLSQFRRWSLNSVYNQASSFSIDQLPVVPSDTEAV
jgi:hypothetical protein